MTENDIRGRCMALKTLARNHVQDEVPKAEKEQAFAVVGAIAELAEQALVDLNRIADALEMIAMNTRPPAI